MLLGVRAVIAKSFERIHRSNLVGMGILPLTFKEDQDAETLGLDGSEYFDISIGDQIEPLSEIQVSARRERGGEIVFPALIRLDTPVEVDYYLNGGILQTVLRNLAKD